MPETTEPRQPAPGAWPTPQQWVWMWEDASPDRRLEIARQVLTQGQKAVECFSHDHTRRIVELQHQLDTERTVAHKVSSALGATTRRLKELVESLVTTVPQLDDHFYEHVRLPPDEMPRMDYNEIGAAAARRADLIRAGVSDEDLVQAEAATAILAAQDGAGPLPMVEVQEPEGAAEVPPHEHTEHGCSVCGGHD